MSFHSGFVGVVGLPNAGKSTLVNALVGEKVSIVTSKPQTTRKRVSGLLSTEEYQAIFTDAPGFIGAQAGLNGFLSEEAKSVIDDVDSLIFVISLANDGLEKLKRNLEFVKQSGKPVLVVLSKADVADKERAQPTIDWIVEQGFNFEIGSSVGSGKGPLKSKVLKWVQSHLPESKVPLFDPEIYTTQTLRELSEEIIRESAFLKVHQEIPFGLGVKILKYDESREDLLKIYAEIWVNRDSHKGIVVGAKGQHLKMIGTDARKRIENLAGCKVYLDLHVKVKKNWIKNDHLLEEMGYVVTQ